MRAELTLLVLAAGSGSRYGGLKQLAPIGPSGESLLEYSIYDAVRAGFTRVVLVVRAASERDFRQRFEEPIGRRVPISFVQQRRDELPEGIVRDAARVKPWGTGQAVLAAAGAIEGAFAVVNADDFYGLESFEALARFLAPNRGLTPPSLAMVGFTLDRTLTDSGPVSRALCRLDGDGFLCDIVEVKEVWRQGGRIFARDRKGAEVTLDGDELVSMNIWGFTSDLFAELRRQFHDFLAGAGRSSTAEFLLPDVVRSLVHEEKARVEILRGTGRWCGITFREDEERAAAMISSLVEGGRYPRELWT